LIFLHFLAEIYQPNNDTLLRTLNWVAWGALELAGIVFLVSMIEDVEDRTKRLGLLTLLGVPALFHLLAATFDWPIRWALVGSVALVFFGGAVFSLRVHKRPAVFHIGLAILLCGVGVWAVRNQLRGNASSAINSIYVLSYGLSGVLYWRRHVRHSVGVIVATTGFLSWGAVWPVGYLIDRVSPNLVLDPEIWNVPKFIVAFGMVLSLIEGKSTIIEQAREREQAKNRLLLRISQITSRLLGGRDPAALCEEIAEAVADTSSFRRVALLLLNDSSTLQLIGASGFPPEAFAQLQQRTLGWTTDKLKEVCAAGTRVGNNSFFVSGVEQALLIPLISWRGSHVGCFWLSATKDEAAADLPDVFNLEVLASDLAVTIENTRLHHRLVRSEKLAALGQLVAGVAHELNNPLTGIIGYTELLSEEVEKPDVIKRVQKLGHEARRMMRIVEGLLRFARQNNPASRVTDLEAALRDVVQLREYQIRKKNIEIDIQIEPGLSPLAIGEDELKQLLLNILNNAVDAVEESAQRSIRIRASRRDNRVVIHFEDTGPGFADLNRAFDPFYTTKPVGKGTGLGLSICYGIAQECGGEITIANRQPYGANVQVEVPVALPHTVLPFRS
jgi:signal transduction histidine kinase